MRSDSTIEETYCSFKVGDWVWSESHWPKMNPTCSQSLISINILQYLLGMNEHLWPCTELNDIDSLSQSLVHICINIRHTQATATKPHPHTVIMKTTTRRRTICTDTYLLRSHSWHATHKSFDTLKQNNTCKLDSKYAASFILQNMLIFNSNNVTSVFSNGQLVMVFCYIQCNSCISLVSNKIFKTPKQKMSLFFSSSL